MANPQHSALTPRGQRTRAKLLSAAERVFGEMGFERASIVEITKTAGVAQGTFYVYFESKHIVFAQLVETLGDSLRSELRQAIAGLDSRMAVEEAGFDAFLAFIGAHRHLYKIVRQAEFVDEALYRRYYTRLAKGYVRGLESAMDHGEFASLDAEAVAYALMGMFDFIGMRWVLWEGTRPPAHVRDAVLSFVRSGLVTGRHS
ncbi:MAG: TetR/AcrR family transcriptional regulator [Nannocystaceae bacterium]|nr:TetR/AcrR family transcriptional regulator [Nannocystaceae bacterium]